MERLSVINASARHRRDLHFSIVSAEMKRPSFTCSMCCPASSTVLSSSLPISLLLAILPLTDLTSSTSTLPISIYSTLSIHSLVSLMTKPKGPSYLEAVSNLNANALVKDLTIPKLINKSAFMSPPTNSKANKATAQPSKPSKAQEVRVSHLSPCRCFY